jgi:hypothetical protein
MPGPRLPKNAPVACRLPDMPGVRLTHASPASCLRPPATSPQTQNGEATPQRSAKFDTPRPSARPPARKVRRKPVSPFEDSCH